MSASAAPTRLRNWEHHSYCHRLLVIHVDCYLNLIADFRARIPHGMTGKLDNRGRIHTHRGNTPWLDVFLQMDDGFGLVQIDNVNGVPHRNRVYSVAGHNPESLTEPEGAGICGHQTAQSGPVRVRD